MRMLVLTLLTFKKVKLIFGHPVLRKSLSSSNKHQINYLNIESIYQSIHLSIK